MIKDKIETGSSNVWAIIKRGLHVVYQNMNKKFCYQYINELSFMLNEGDCARDTQDRIDDQFKVISGKTITYLDLMT